jgi:hypothetical protein
VDVEYDVIWRVGDGDDAVDTVLATATHTFIAPVAPANPRDAVAFETDLTGIAANAVAGDTLVLRFLVTNGPMGANFTPNGDGPMANGRYPSLTLPQP